MENKTLEFVKNGAIATVPFVAGGVVGAELSDLVTDNETIIAASSTASQYIAGYATFLGLHAYDNKDVYRQDGKWKWGTLMVDTAKLVFSMGAAELAYILGRPYIMNYFLERDYGTTNSSLLADAICIPLFFAVAIPLAKKLGFIKDKKD